MTPNELQTIRFLCESLLWGLALVLGVVLPWVASGTRLRIPRVEIGAWAPRRGWDRGNKGEGRRPKSKIRGRKSKGTGGAGAVSSMPATVPEPAFVWDQEALDAVAACRSLGFKEKEARAVVEELRVKGPELDCAGLTKQAIGRLGRR